MKLGYALITVTLLATLMSSTGCHRTSREVWEDTKTCGRYLDRGLRSLLGQHIDTREYAPYEAVWEEASEPFIPLAGAPQWHEVGNTLPAAKEAPGDPGSPIPGIDGFTSPMGEMAKLFRNIHFETDYYAIKGTDNVQTLRQISNYLSAHPRVYVFVEGHADERGAAAYNLSLGVKRANAIRVFLIENGAHPDQLFTVSYGKERPVAFGHDEEAWHQNRRGQFKVYEK
jgi:peptidoglycan-associated lipoprotein